MAELLRCIRVHILMGDVADLRRDKVRGLNHLLTGRLRHAVGVGPLNITIILIGTTHRLLVVWTPMRVCGPIRTVVWGIRLVPL